MNKDYIYYQICRLSNNFNQIEEDSWMTDRLDANGEESGILIDYESLWRRGSVKKLS